MGKTRRGEREYSREQRLNQENKKLKKQISSLRKQLARTDLDKFSSAKDLIEQHYQDDRAQEGQDIIEKLKKVWECHKCNQGFLEIFTYSRINETWYFRRCSNESCRHRTKSQPYTPEVKGIRKENNDL